MSHHRIPSLLAVLLAAAALCGIPASAGAATAPRASAPATGGPVSHPLFPDDSAPRGAGSSSRAAATSGPAPFLTRPYWGRHYVTSVFDHCNPNYSHDGRICEEDGTVAYSSSGHAPDFYWGYPVTPGGTDYLYYDGHDGWDIGLNYETLIAAAEGNVTVAGCDAYSGCSGGFGLTVVIDHGNGFSTRYGHMSTISVSAGQHVLRGQQIGVSGNTGASTGPHLHFGLYLTGSMTAIDPWGWSASTADPWPYDQGDLWITGNMRDPVPDPPTGVTATAGSGGIQVTWVPPAFNGGETITSYTVTPSNGGAPAVVPGTATSANFTNLVNGTSYTFTVVATNKIASSAASAPSNAVVFNSPAALSFTAPQASYANADFDVAWSTPQPGTYDVAVSEDGGGWLGWLAATTAHTAHYYGLAGHSYRFQVVSHVGAFTDSETTAAYAVATAAHQAFPVSSLELTEAGGAIDPAGSEIMAHAPSFGFDITRASVLLPGGDGGYLLDGYGGIHPFGTALPVNGAPYFGFDIARDIVLAPGLPGGYVLDGYGGIHPFGIGSASPPALPTGEPYWPGWDIARKFTLAGTGGYLLDGFGGIHPLNGAPAVQVAAIFGFDIARAIVTIPGTHAGLVLDGYGGVHPWSADSTAPATPSSPGYWPGQDVACALVLAPGATMAAPIGYKVDSSGGVNPVAGATAIPQPATHGPVRSAAAA